jgi:2-iminobutanoate/2-iminopropanoate deaminase
VIAGPFIFVSGQLPYDPETGQIRGSEIATQTSQVISNVERLLKSAGASLADVVSVTAYLNNISDWDVFNKT